MENVSLFSLFLASSERGFVKKKGKNITLENIITQFSDIHFRILLIYTAENAKQVCQIFRFQFIIIHKTPMFHGPYHLHIRVFEMQIKIQTALISAVT